jgi:hypothetical protein
MGGPGDSELLAPSWLRRDQFWAILQCKSMFCRGRARGKTQIVSASAIL